MRRTLVPLGAAAVLAVGACTSPPQAEVEPPVDWIKGSAQLSTYDSCEEALEDLQRSALRTMTQVRRPDGARDGAEVEENAMAGDDSAAAADDLDTAPSHSETNVAVSGVDEPDIVKTDGEFIYAATDNALRVVHAARGEVVAEREFGWEAWDLSLFLGDDELLLLYSQDYEDGEVYYSEFVVERLDPSSLEVLDTFSIDGSLLDARMVDGEVRLAVSSSPQMWDMFYEYGDDVSELRKAVRSTTIEEWLPAYSVNGESGRAGCDSIAHPDQFDGSATVSVLALDADGAWSDMDPVTVMADGGTVHGTADSLYLAHNDYSRDEENPEAETEIYRFVFDGARPRLAGEAAVPGTLLNQYSMSEYDGHLRVATTENEAFWWGWEGDVLEDTDSSEDVAEPEPSKSTVTVLEIGDDALTEVGSVTDLGVDERIYAVRFMGETGYLVTFRQTDPLYTLDLSDPSSPEVTGELKITGYSAYLHPVGDGRLLGLGQEATEDGVTTGLQVSLFDTAGDQAEVLDQYERPGSASEAEWDPHGFLYWEREGIVVVPVTDWSEYEYASGALVLEVGDDSLSEAAWIAHEPPSGEEDEDYYFDNSVLRSLVIGDTLWTLSNSGLMATEIGGGYDTAEWLAW